jgi:hypothetical protein
LEERRRFVTSWGAVVGNGGNGESENEDDLIIRHFLRSLARSVIPR